MLCFVDHRLSFCPFTFGHCVVCLLVIVLSVLLELTASDYPFDIFKLFFDKPPSYHLFINVCHSKTFCAQEIITHRDGLCSINGAILFLILINIPYNYQKF